MDMDMGGDGHADDGFADDDNQGFPLTAELNESSEGLMVEGTNAESDSDLIFKTGVMDMSQTAVDEKNDHGEVNDLALAAPATMPALPVAAAAPAAVPAALAPGPPPNGHIPPTILPPEQVRYHGPIAMFPRPVAQGA